MNRLQPYYLTAGAVILFCAAAMNLLGAGGLAPVLNQPDALLQFTDKLGISNRWVMILKAVLELLASGFLLMGNSLKLGLMAWLATSLITYRIGLMWVGAPVYSDCIGNLVGWFTISPRILGLISSFFLVAMFVGSYAFLLLNWLKARKPVPAAEEASSPV